MKGLQASGALVLFALLLFPAVAAASPADEGAGEIHISIEAGELGDADFTLEDLAVGESRTFTTDEGKVVLVTRTEAGYELDVDGEEITIALEEGEGFSFHTLDGEEGEGLVVIRTGEKGESGSAFSIVTLGGEGEEGEVKKHVIKAVKGEEGMEVKVLDAGEEIDLGDFAAEGAEGARVIVLKKKVEGEEGEAKIIRVQVKTKKEKEGDG